MVFQGFKLLLCHGQASSSPLLLSEDNGFLNVLIRLFISLLPAQSLAT